MTNKNVYYILQVQLLFLTSFIYLSTISCSTEKWDSFQGDLTDCCIALQINNQDKLSVTLGVPKVV